MHKNTITAYAFLQGYMGKEAAVGLPNDLSLREPELYPQQGSQLATPAPITPTAPQPGSKQVPSAPVGTAPAPDRSKGSVAAPVAPTPPAPTTPTTRPVQQRQPMTDQDQKHQQKLDRIDARNSATASQLHGTNQRRNQISAESTDRWLDTTERKQREQLQTGLQNNDPRYVNHILNKGDTARQDRLSQDVNRRSAARSAYNNRHSGTFYDTQTNQAVSNSQALPFRTNPAVAAAKAAQDATHPEGAAGAAEARRQAARDALAPLPQATPYQSPALNFGDPLPEADSTGAEAYSAARQAAVKDVEGQLQDNARGYVDSTYKPFKTSGGQDTGAYIAPGGTLVGAGALNRRVGQHLRPQLAEARRWSAANAPTPAQLEGMKQQDVDAAAAAKAPQQHQQPHTASVEPATSDTITNTNQSTDSDNKTPLQLINSHSNPRAWPTPGRKDSHRNFQATNNMIDTYLARTDRTSATDAAASAKLINMLRMDGYGDENIKNILTFNTLPIPDMLLNKHT